MSVSERRGERLRLRFEGPEGDRERDLRSAIFVVVVERFDVGRGGDGEAGQKAGKAEGFVAERLARIYPSGGQIRWNFNLTLRTHLCIYVILVISIYSCLRALQSFFKFPHIACNI